MLGIENKKTQAQPLNFEVLDHERGIHRYWREVVIAERPHDYAAVIKTIEGRLKSGLINEQQLIEWGKEFEQDPHTLVETLLYFGIDFDLE